MGNEVVFQIDSQSYVNECEIVYIYAILVSLSHYNFQNRLLIRMSKKMIVIKQPLYCVTSNI